MNDWASLSIRHRMMAAFFSLFAMVGLVGVALKSPSATALLTALPVPMVMLAVALNPANYKNGMVLKWAAQPRLSKVLFFAGRK